MLKWVCTEEGVPDHAFDVDLFFYESQGERLPRKCPSHRNVGSMTATREEMGAFGGFGVGSLSEWMPELKHVGAISSSFVAGFWDSLSSAS
ncbi:hypothetical protein QBC38DRAFT_453864 [Podospora fimiseda]|uniref:Uncharacterized protein n=1 Tax=Podospora fimiseda TaxID=252190 RepID=A0AAN7BTQ5_9PEZI|nr:hypothetical protein QBC38DRAFT_453864 [Podospora fimiseda]